MNNKLIGLLALILLNACTPSTAYKESVNDPEYFQRSVKALTDIIIHDIFSPPVASRIYAYPSIAAYEVLASGNDEFKSLAGQLKGFSMPPQSDTTKDISLEVAALQAYTQVGKALIFSEEKMEKYQKQLWTEIDNTGIPSDVFDRSKAYGQEVADHVLAWADKDNYKQTRTFPKYTILEDQDAWKPTPPDYMDGIEPHWNKIRPFVIDSATQFVPEPPTPFNMDESSQFYQELIEVYETGKNLTDEEEEIAKFWDCNPYVSHHAGHAMFATKKITPGGHWMGITAIATRKAESSFMETTEAYALTSIALFDAFISCWDEKWRSILIRPETVINEYLDESWAPLLQTPPFPEYTSGHSVISTAAAYTLTDLFGENFSFLDTTEMEFGLPARSFNSFIDASSEAAVSRLYGGIHYMPAIDNGVSQGKNVGEFILKKLETRNEPGANRVSIKE
ncbi:MAG: vanadium-dependent haloperoxidase [Cyclobacteriaceae bacterium]